MHRRPLRGLSAGRVEPFGDRLDHTPQAVEIAGEFAWPSRPWRESDLAPGTAVVDPENLGYVRLRSDQSRLHAVELTWHGVHDDQGRAEWVKDLQRCADLIRCCNVVGGHQDLDRSLRDEPAGVDQTAILDRDLAVESQEQGARQCGGSNAAFDSGHTQRPRLLPTRHRFPRNWLCDTAQRCRLRRSRVGQADSVVLPVDVAGPARDRSDCVASVQVQHQRSVGLRRLDGPVPRRVRTIARPPPVPVQTSQPPIAGTARPPLR
jgi:hypothetical protein